MLKIGKILIKQVKVQMNRSLSNQYHLFIFLSVRPSFTISSLHEVIDISSDDSLASLSTLLKRDPSPANRRDKQGQGQYIPSTASTKPGKLQLGHAAKEKQAHQDLVAARGKKTGVESTTSWIHFSIGLRWCIYDEFGGDEWYKPERDHSVSIENVDLTTDDLIKLFWKKLYNKIKRNEIRARLKPQGQGEWFLSHTEPTVRNNPQEIDTWDVAERLSGVIERGIFNYKKVIDGRKQYNLWLCWLPKAPTPRPVPASEIDTPVPRKKAAKKDITIKQEDQQEVKQEFKQEIKQEDKEEPNELASPWTPTPVMTLPKRPRTVSSDFITPPRAPKQPIRKKPAKQADSNVRTRKQKEEKGESLLGGIGK
jgi:hypothetical protein